MTLKEHFDKRSQERFEHLLIDLPPAEQGRRRLIRAAATGDQEWSDEGLERLRRAVDEEPEHPIGTILLVFGVAVLALFLAVAAAIVYAGRGI